MNINCWERFQVRLIVDDPNEMAWLCWVSWTQWQYVFLDPRYLLHDFHPLYQSQWEHPWWTIRWLEILRHSRVKEIANTFEQNKILEEKKSWYKESELYFREKKDSTYRVRSFSDFYSYCFRLSMRISRILY